MRKPECPVQDASAEELGRESGLELPESEPERSLLVLAQGLNNLAAALDEQNQMLSMIVAQNADLIAAIADKEENEAPRYDLSGRPL